MATVVHLPQSKNSQALEQGAADFSSALVSTFLQRREDKRLNEQRRTVEEQIRSAVDEQEALTVLENAPAEVRSRYEKELKETIQSRFPETELVNVLRNGELTTITQPSNRPFTDEELTEQGVERARQFAIIATKPDTGELEILDSALGAGAAEEDLARLREMFPDRDFQIAQGPEIQTFQEIRAQQLERQRIEASREATAASGNDLTQNEREILAELEIAAQNDPLATSAGVQVRVANQDDLQQEALAQNGTLANGEFSFRSPDHSTNFNEMMIVGSTVMNRGGDLNLARKLMESRRLINTAGSTSLLEGFSESIDNTISKRFGIPEIDGFATPAETLEQSMEFLTSQPAFQQLPEFNPASPQTLSFGIDVDEDGTPETSIRIVKINGLPAILER